MCFVQFKDVSDSELPRIYLAWPKEVAGVLKNARDGKGVTKLIEGRWLRGRSFFGVVPDGWQMTQDRVKRMLNLN